MCTLSIYKNKKRCIVTMNRDELRNRDQAVRLNTEIYGPAARLLYPVDEPSQGTWIAGNDHGVVLCLLNNYQGELANLAAVPSSRGIIIPAALAQGSCKKVRKHLQNLVVQLFRPFDLFLLTRKKLMQFTYDGVDYRWQELPLGSWFMFSSSSYKVDEVLSYRYELFRKWTAEVGEENIESEEILHGFHRIQIPNLETHSVLMERERSQTKSITQFVIGKKHISMEYYPLSRASQNESPATGELELVH